MTLASTANLNATTPSPATGKQNIVFADDSGSPTVNISATDPEMIGDSGSGGTAGNVPAPGAGDAAAGKFLKADGTFAVPAGSAPSGSANEVFATPNGSSGAASLRALVPADLPVATTSALGAVKPDGSTIDISAGVISVPIATDSNLGLVEPDGTTITISAGVITAVGGGGGGITELTGDVTAGPGSGSQAATVVNIPPGVALTGTPSAGQVPTATGSAAATWQTPSGGGGADLFFLETVASPTATITISSIPGTYTNMRLVISGCSSASDTAIIYINFNGDTAAHYDYAYTQAGAFGGSGNSNGQANGWAGLIAGASSDFWGSTSEAKIGGYAQASLFKTLVSNWASFSNGADGLAVGTYGTQWVSIDAITEIVLTIAGGYNFAVGTTIALYLE
jgi:hypothetical protein